MWEEIAGCRCRKVKGSRNVIASKVVEAQFVPASKQRASYLSNVISPKFLSSYKPLW